MVVPVCNVDGSGFGDLEDRPLDEHNQQELMVLRCRDRSAGCQHLLYVQEILAQNEEACYELWPFIQHAYVDFFPKFCPQKKKREKSGALQFLSNNYDSIFGLRPPENWTLSLFFDERPTYFEYGFVDK
jgi:hypothetical protein